jgi:hypothetical protein
MRESRVANSIDREFYNRRRDQELEASDAATDPVIKRLHWEMAQRYSWLARQEDVATMPTASSIVG